MGLGGGEGREREEGGGSQAHSGLAIWDEM